MNRPRVSGRRTKDAVRLLIVDDHDILRKGLVEIFTEWSRIGSISEAASGEEAVARLAQGEIDLVLLDWTLPGLSGVPLVQRLVESQRAVPILVLTMHEEALVASAALKAGASGYLTKGCTSEVVFSAVEALLRGGSFVDRQIASQLCTMRHRGAKGLAGGLSLRQQQVYRLLCCGVGVQQIASQLGISPKSVSTHKAVLKRKTGVRSDAELLRFGLTHGIDLNAAL